MSLYFTQDHEYVRIDGDHAIVGITDHAQKQLGDVVFVELPAKSKILKKGEQAAVVESVKAASEVYAPISGTIVESNGAIEADPSLVNQDAENNGWFFKMTVQDRDQLAGLMDATAYQKFVASLA